MGRWLHILRLTRQHNPRVSCRPRIRQHWPLRHCQERTTSSLQSTSPPKENPTVSASHVHHSTCIIPERRIPGSRMNSSAGPSKVSSSGQRQLTFSRLIPSSEETSSSGCTYVMSRPQWSKILTTPVSVLQSRPSTMPSTLFVSCERTRVKKRAHRCGRW